MNHVPIILLAFGAGLACGAWAVWLLMRAGEKRLEQMLSAAMDGKVIDQMQRAKDKAALVYDSRAVSEPWYWCTECEALVCLVEYDGREYLECDCETEAGFDDATPDKWQRVQVIARRVEQ